MSIYTDALDALQRIGLHGGTLTPLEHKALLAVVRATGTAGTSAAASDAQVQSACTDARNMCVDATTNDGLVDAQFDILDAFDGSSTIGDVITAIATASGLLRASATNLGGTVGVAVYTACGTAKTLSTAALADVPDPATLPLNPVIDGVW